MQINFRTEARLRHPSPTHTHMSCIHTPASRRRSAPTPRAGTSYLRSAPAPTPAEGTARRFITPQNAVAGQRRNRTKENRVADTYNAVSVRSEADSNRCTRFCRPLPSHSAIRPFLSRNAPFSFSLQHLRDPLKPPRHLLQHLRDFLSPLGSFSGPLRISLGLPSGRLRVVSVRKYTHFSDICKTYSQLYAFSASNPSVFARKSLPLSPAKESPRP